MSDQNTPTNSDKPDSQGEQTNVTSTQEALGVPSQGSGNQSTTNDLDALQQQIESLKKDNFDYRERERKRKEAEEQEKQKSLAEQGKYKELLEEMKKQNSTVSSDLESYKSKVEKYETVFKNMTESQFKKLTSEQQKHFIRLFGPDLDPATKLEKIDVFLETIPQNATPRPGSPIKQGTKDAITAALKEAENDRAKRKEFSKTENVVDFFKTILSS